jgi:Na+-transporting NADH:ubiquinone oxidoreductase subunit NqrD
MEKCFFFCCLKLNQSAVYESIDLNTLLSPQPFDVSILPALSFFTINLLYPAAADRVFLIHNMVVQAALLVLVDTLP